MSKKRLPPSIYFTSSSSPLPLVPSDLAPGTGPASELTVLPVHHHDILDQRGHALFELPMGGVLADIVVAVLGAGKLNHLCPARKSAQATK